MSSSNVEILNATFTPMHEDGAINYDRVPDLFQHCISTGANGIFLNGTTGECMSLSFAERLKLVEAWTEHRKAINRPDFKIFVHVGSCNLYETACMAEHAQSHGTFAGLTLGGGDVHASSHAGEANGIGPARGVVTPPASPVGAAPRRCRTW